MKNSEMVYKELADGALQRLASVQDDNRRLRELLARAQTARRNASDRVCKLMAALNACGVSDATIEVVLQSKDEETAVAVVEASRVLSS